MAEARTSRRNPMLSGNRLRGREMSLPARSLTELLVESGLLPAIAADGFERFSLPQRSANLLPVLIPVWQSALEQAPNVRQRKRVSRMLAWLRGCAEGGACLTWGVPPLNQPALAAWVGPRLAWWPRGVPPGRRVGLVSSRLGRKLENQQSWFTVLRAACAKLDPDVDLLLATEMTTTSRFVQRCAVLFGLGLLCIEWSDDNRCSPARWVRRIRQWEPHGDGEVRLEHVYLSPRIIPDAGRGEDPIRSSLHKIPLRDRALVALSDELVVLHVRAGGNLDQLIRARLQDTAWPPASVHVALGVQLVVPQLANELLGAGAVGWMVLDTLRREISPKATSPVPSPGPFTTRHPRSSGQIIALPEMQPGDYLTHCTRRRDGPWPGQHEDAYLDDLIVDRDGGDHSPLAALKRIITQCRLIASGKAIRRGAGVVSFTAVPLAELHHIRVFRPHRSRWDFQPYGMCIEQQWLRQRKTRPVRYATEKEWADLSTHERPFFQLEGTKPYRGRSRIDWTVEQEWRHLGDLPLDDLPPNAGFVFVASLAEAEEMAAVSRWPVTVVGTQE